MKMQKLCYITITALMACLIQTASAQDSHWNGTINNTDWNVATNWNPAGVPPPGNATTTFTGNVWLDPSPVDGDTVVTIPQGDVEMPGVGNTNEVYNTIFGPEFGCTLNVYGTLTFDWTIAPYQPDPTPGARSHINIWDTGYLYTSGASLNLGSGWWPVCEGTYCTMNLYGNGKYSSLGGAGLWSGGHINIYDSSVALFNGYVNLDNGQANNDGTTYFLVGGGTLMLPEGFNTSTVTNWIQRGILRAYGKGYDTNDLVVSDNGTNTIVTAVPLGGTLQRVYFEPLIRPTVQVGTFQQAMLVGDYPSVSGVLLSSPEPGVDPATFTHPVYTSSNPSVATINTNGMVTAISPGNATLTATVGAFTSTNSISITVAPVAATLIHRYSFATDASDSVGSANGTLDGDATVAGGQLVLSGNVGSSVTLPAGTLAGLDEITIETWATFPSTNAPFANLFAFGFSDTDPLSATYGDGGNYVAFSPHTGGNTAQLNFGQGVPGSSGERDAVISQTLDYQTNIQIVAVLHPLAGSEAFYTNGVLAASISMWNNLIDPVANAGPTFTNVNTGVPGGSILAYTLGTDPVNYIGQSLYTADPGLLADINEFRIYNGPLTASQIAADYALGPNQLRGTSTGPVSLSVTQSGSNLMFSWPTSSALVTLMSSPTLGPSATWTQVAVPSGALTASGGNYQLTLPMSGSAQFYRLSQ
jgi:Bacterial Ig-like domain (group 2)